MKIYVDENQFLHHMNRYSLNKMIEYLGWEKVSSIQQAEIIYSPSEIMNNDDYPNKKFIYGPHFEVFPNKAFRISNKYNNAIYIQPSEQTKNFWLEYKYNKIPMKILPFPIDIEIYNNNNKNNNKNIVLIYLKRRKASELNEIVNRLENKKIEYKIIRYGTYKEEEYIENLKKTKYIIWIGTHESQGFALLCALSMNIPILVWSSRYMCQEVGCPLEYYNIRSKNKTNPYWSDECGEEFYDIKDFDEKHNKIIKNINNYRPREYIKNNLSVEKCSEILKNLFINKITLVTCFYSIKSKFEKNKYYEWMRNMLENVINANIVIYTDEENYNIIRDIREKKNLMDRTKIIVKNTKNFYVDKYRREFIINNINNKYLPNVSYELHMIWHEKINFVRDSIENKYFDSEYYSWCDIGYFRCNENNIKIEDIINFPNDLKIKNLNKEKIYYGLVNKNEEYMKMLEVMINRNDEIPENQISIAGGFFILHRDKINYWHNIYYKKLDEYFINKKLIKDDQIIIVNCILDKKNRNNFELIKNDDNNFDSWFIFSKYLI